MVALVRDRKLDEARALQQRLMPLARSVGSIFGVPGLKAALELCGFTGSAPRAPLRPVSSHNMNIIRGQLDELGVLPRAQADLSVAASTPAHDRASR